MPRIAYLLALFSLIAVAAAQAADKDKPAEKKGKSSNAAERAVQNTSKKAEKVADRATNATGRGLKKAEKGVNSVGEKVGKWFKDKTD
jgi:hypothetical protein